VTVTPVLVKTALSVNPFSFVILTAGPAPRTRSALPPGVLT